MGIPIEPAPLELRKTRTSGLVQTLRMMDLGNESLLEFLSNNLDNSEDCFTGYDECYILPRTKEFAKTLAETCWDYGDDSCRVADECCWMQADNGRYWLYLWWD